VYVPPSSGSDVTDERAEAAHAQTTLLKWIRELDDFDAGVLQAAYMARPWPPRLFTELGRLTGVVARLGSVEVGLPEKRHELEALELRTAARLDDALARNASVVKCLQLRASPLLERAFEAYVRERGGEKKPVFRGIP
jgi:hypothetical protein